MQRQCFIFAAGLLFIAACSRRPQPAAEPPGKTQVPVGILIDQQIAGGIVGRTLMSPAGVAVDRQGVLYLVDAGNHRLIRFNPDLMPLRDAGGHGSQPGLLDRPGFAAIDSDLNILVSDAGNRRLCRYNSRLEFVEEISLQDEEDPLKFGLPSGLAITSFGEIWVADEQNNRLAVFDNIGRFDRFVGGFAYGGGELLAPQKLVAVDDQEFYVCDGGNGRIVVYDEYGNFEREVIDDELASPHGMALDPLGRLWVADQTTGRLHCFSRDGQKLLSFGPLLAGSDAPLRAPFDLAMLPDGRLAISDTGNHRLLICRILYEDR